MRLDTKKAEFMKSIMFDKDIIDDMSDDHAVKIMRSAGKYYEINTCKTLLSIPTIYILSPNKYTLFMLTMRTYTLFEVHTMILKPGRGELAVKDTRRAAKWVFENTTCEKVITYVPVFNRSAQFFARIIPMIYEGNCTKSFRKNGVLHDQYVFGLEKEALCQQ